MKLFSTLMIVVFLLSSISLSVIAAEQAAPPASVAPVSYTCADLYSKKLVEKNRKKYDFAHSDFGYFVLALSTFGAGEAAVTGAAALGLGVMAIPVGVLAMVTPAAVEAVWLNHKTKEERLSALQELGSKEFKKFMTKIQKDYPAATDEQVAKILDYGMKSGDFCAKLPHTLSQRAIRKYVELKMPQSVVPVTEKKFTCAELVGIQAHNSSQSLHLIENDIAEISFMSMFATISVPPLCLGFFGLTVADLAVEVAAKPRSEKLSELLQYGYSREFVKLEKEAQKMCGKAKRADLEKAITEIYTSGKVCEAYPKLMKYNDVKKLILSNLKNCSQVVDPNKITQGSTDAPSSCGCSDGTCTPENQ